jgi:hypothetical protein
MKGSDPFIFLPFLAEKRRPEGRLGGHAQPLSSGAAGRGPGWRVRKRFRHQPHFESAQDRQVMQPSISTTAAVLHLAQSCAPSG